MILYKEVENIVLSKFEKSISSTKYSLIRNYRFQSSESRSVEIDGLIKTEEGYPYAVIEVKLNAERADSRVKRQLIDCLLLTQSKYGILADKNSYYLVESTKLEFKKFEYDELVKKLFATVFNFRPQQKKICDYLNKEFKSLNLNFVENDILFDDNKFTISENTEKKFIDKLFKFEDFTKPVYRYIPLNTGFEMLKNNNIRMMGIAGMNDISEVDYVENYLYPSPNVRPLSPEINRVFITSCSYDDKDENLTQWRLYADDAKGIRLKFNKNNSYDNKKNIGDFIVRSVKYLDIKTSNELTQLKKLIDFVYDATGYTLIFSTFHEWCHFIKPTDYEIEKEVRVLYKLSESETPSGWLLASGINIINPYVEFKLDQFPLTIENIKLGPKCPEKRMNQFQIKTLAQEKTKLNVNANFVKESDIKNYR